MRVILYTALFLLIIFFACKKKDNTPQGENDIWLLYKQFNPTLIDIKKGTTLSFINKDNANHTVTEVNKAFSSGKIKSGNKYEFTFNDSGAYSAYCNYHPDNLQETIYIRVK